MDLKFFLPFWPADGVVDYDFIQDQKLSDEKKRIWHVFDEPPIDGALISRANIDDTKWLKKEIKEKGIHETLDYHQGPVICDCGAFDYVDQEEPTYDPEETLEFYEEYGFDLGEDVEQLSQDVDDLRSKVDRKLSTWEKLTQNDDFCSKSRLNQKIIWELVKIKENDSPKNQRDVAQEYNLTDARISQLKEFIRANDLP